MRERMIIFSNAALIEGAKLCDLGPKLLYLTFSASTHTVLALVLIQCFLLKIIYSLYNIYSRKGTTKEFVGWIWGWLAVDGYHQPAWFGGELLGMHGHRQTPKL